MTYPVDDGITVELADHILTITFNRPEVQNAFTPDQANFLGRVFRIAENDDNVRVAVLTGSGDWFCAGADLRGVDLSASGGQIPPVGSHSNVFNPVLDFSKPLIASINGGVAGGGLGFALCCDLRIASSTARIAASFLRIGITANDAVSYLLPRIVGVAKALELIYLARPIDATEAERIGLVSYVVAPEDLAGRTLELARAFAAAPPFAARLSKRMVLEGMNRTYREHILAQEYSSLANRYIANHDIEEGLAAFKEKRPAQFRGVVAPRTWENY